MKDAATSHGSGSPSEWIVRWSHLLAADATVLDVACGAGRHMQWFAGRGHSVTGVDRSPEATDAAGTFGQTITADIESGPWPFTGQTFGAVVVTNYLWRARMADIVTAVAPGGVLLYETFAAGNETVGKPSRADFLLQPGELLAACQDLRVVAYEDGFLPEPARFVQRIAAIRAPEPLAGHPLRALLKGK
ncbi:methyltransferase domain-containing protein [Variovorax sp. RKNM96]|uniref:class I SAM-dependent methyltransferase n=1 Tax=Variovorax sp. RKNM96 TaxID=2681552 RepID=UPI00197E60E3|nr:class I SAM-dependent methyltransferase [Variovorax sp. RKNM96]QSI30077.1 methyltransferase domain-containing protein [Variovorax sp. RKNM96]